MVDEWKKKNKTTTTGNRGTVALGTINRGQVVDRGWHAWLGWARHTVGPPKFFQIVGDEYPQQVRQTGRCDGSICGDLGRARVWMKHILQKRHIHFHVRRVHSHAHYIHRRKEDFGDKQTLLLHNHSEYMDALIPSIDRVDQIGVPHLSEGCLKR